jgi:hypothetical protein
MSIWSRKDRKRTVMKAFDRRFLARQLLADHHAFYAAREYKRQERCDIQKHINILNEK